MSSTLVVRVRNSLIEDLYFKTIFNHISLFLMTNCATINVDHTTLMTVVSLVYKGTPWNKTN